MSASGISVRVTGDASGFLSAVTGTRNYVTALGGDLAALGGILRCETCGTTQPVGDVGAHLGGGWPEHHGLTMRWVTQRELDEEAEGSTR
jgi:hypothetical protein